MTIRDYDILQYVKCQAYIVNGVTIIAYYMIYHRWLCLANIFSIANKLYLIIAYVLSLPYFDIIRIPIYLCKTITNKYILARHAGVWVDSSSAILCINIKCKFNCEWHWLFPYMWILYVHNERLWECLQCVLDGRGYQEHYTTKLHKVSLSTKSCTFITERCNKQKFTPLWRCRLTVLFILY